MITRRTAICSLAGVLVCRQGRAQASLESVKLAINPSVYAYLPLYVAIDKGYFRANGIEVLISKYTGSATTQLPLLARGDLDFSPVVGSAALFNQFEQGFNIKLVTALIGVRKGWHDSTWILCRKALWDTGVMKNATDMKGKRVDGGPEGSPIMFLTSQALRTGQLSTADVTYSQKFRGPSDFLGAFRNNAVDVLGAPEPLAAQLEAEGLAHRWLSASDFAPWFQETFLAANPDFLVKRPDAAKRFIKGYLSGARDVLEAGPRWTAEMLTITSTWSGLKHDVLTRIPGPVFPGEGGRIDQDSLVRQQRFWLEQGKVKSLLPVSAMVDTTHLDAAAAELRS